MQFGAIFSREDVTQPLIEEKIKALSYFLA
jgi:hypothetical protein